jgi:hypothetical protein
MATRFAVIAYEDKLNSNLDWALREGSMHFDERNEVHKTLKQITRRLSEAGIPYAVVGGMAMFAHGFRRFTEDVDLLVTREGMNRVIEKLEGLGYVQPPGTSTKLRDTQTGVRVEFLITGGFPGDGKPKPVSFPDPVHVSTTIDGISYLNLPTLIELKLASGISNAARIKDLGDVVELIKALKLSKDFGEKLNPYVRAKFDELWDAVKNDPVKDEF